MPTLKLRQDNVRTVPYQGRGGKHQCVYWDEALESFGLRVYPSGGGGEAMQRGEVRFHEQIVPQWHPVRTPVLAVELRCRSETREWTAVRLARPAEFEPATRSFGVWADHCAHVLPNTPDLVFQ